MTRLLLPAVALLALLAGGATAAETVADRVFGVSLFGDVAAPAKLRYRYEMPGQGVDPPVVSHIDLDVREAVADGSKSVYVDMFEGSNHREFGPIASKEQNPLILVFLQRDVNQMSNLTGGAAMYFQQQIRRAFQDEAESEPVEVTLGDQKLQGRRLVMRPFLHDPQIGRFPQFKDKAYEFVVAEGVPGGVYSLATRTLDPKDGHLVLAETVTFQDVAP
jgi:hypothetical protein